MTKEEQSIGPVEPSPLMEAARRMVDACEGIEPEVKPQLTAFASRALQFVVQARAARLDAERHNATFRSSILELASVERFGDQDRAAQIILMGLARQSGRKSFTETVRGERNHQSFENKVSAYPLVIGGVAVEITRFESLSDQGALVVYQIHDIDTSESSQL